MKLLSKLLVIFLVIIASNGFAQSRYSKQYIKVARKSYMHSLNSKNHGVRNSAIFLVIRFKKQLPEENVKPFIKKLTTMSTNDPEIQNRLHAYLALVCLENP